METIKINGEDYVKASSVVNSTKAASVDGLEYKIIRTYSA